MVAFAILQLSHYSILLAFSLFCCFLTPWLLPSRHYCFSCLGCRTVLHFSPPFLILAAIFLPCHFHRCRPFYRCSASNIAAFHSRLGLIQNILLGRGDINVRQRVVRACELIDLVKGMDVKRLAGWTVLDQWACTNSGDLHSCYWMYMGWKFWLY